VKKMPTEDNSHNRDPDKSQAFAEKSLKCSSKRWERMVHSSLDSRKEMQMVKGYWIARVDVTDPERYKAYIEANAQAFKKYGARFLVRGGRFENPEGSTRSRNVVIEFPSYQAALDCYESPEYQEAIKLRQAVSTGDLVIIEGYEGAQPS